MITLTEAASKQIEKLCIDNNLYAVKLDMKGGGCAGFEYDWSTAELESDVTERSTIVQAGTKLLAVSPMSLLYLFGSEIDYKVTLTGASFEINNPMAKGSCGCGVSITIDMDKVAENTN